MAPAVPTTRRSASPAHGGRRERRRTETRERIFRAALDLFAERGFMETTVEDITEAADVGKGTFFNYFPTKEHVLATYGAERLATVERALQEAKKGDRPVMDVLRDLATGIAGQAAESPALVRAIYAAHASCTAVRDELQTRMHTARRLLGQIFRLAQQRGEVRRDVSPMVLARLVQTVFHGVMGSWALNPAGSLRGTAEEIWDLLSPGLASLSPEHAPSRGKNSRE
ncbi:MAG TPA: TetR family transcriptional regulator [Candidatus Acidoferrales bacterium]|nr:TetR family transcriptional regulator [Candidatus Acidoferrales bacterium]